MVSYLQPLTLCGEPWGGKRVLNYPVDGTDWFARIPHYYMVNCIYGTVVKSCQPSNILYSVQWTITYERRQSITKSWYHSIIKKKVNLVSCCKYIFGTNFCKEFLVLLQQHCSNLIRWCKKIIIRLKCFKTHAPVISRHWR